MTDLRVEDIILPGVDFHGVSPLPAISENLRLTFMQDKFELDEEDGLFVNYGMVDYGFPYKAQDNYDRELCERPYPAVILENEHLRAIFMPCFGAKLYSLFDKDECRELLFVNDVVRPCHLGVRNAWMSGGVEWNCGYVGHNPFTCDWMHTARTRLEDGTPVLRFYQFERIRCIVYQMDVFLPEGSKLLYVRTRLVNPNFRVVPMYWWSNIAAPDAPGNRVIIPADSTFTARDSHPVKIRIPEYNGIDVTYPLDNVISIDYFWNIPQAERKFICQVDSKGYGLIQTSTRRLQGRKLFLVLAVWTIIVLYMFFWALMSAFKTNIDYLREPLSLPDLLHLQWENFTLAIDLLEFNNVGFFGMLWNSIWLVFGSSILASLSICVTGYIFAQYEFRGRELLFKIVLFIMIIPIYGSLPATYRLIYSLGLNDSPLYLVTQIGGFSANMMITYGFFKGVPRAYREAVYVDGGSDWKAFTTIGLPMGKNILIAFFLLNFVQFWNDYNTPLLYFNERPTLALGRGQLPCILCRRAYRHDPDTAYLHILLG